MLEIKDIILILSSGILTFLLVFILGPIFIKYVKLLRVKQPILKYLDNHKIKESTPTFGGFIFIIPIAIVSIVIKTGILSLTTISIMFIFSFIGFLDDIIKIKRANNKGLKSYQKFLAQLIFSIAIAIFIYNSDLVGSSLKIPFTNYEINMRFFYIIFSIFMYLAVTNSVNLTDGLDGLATGPSIFVMFTLFITCILTYLNNDQKDEMLAMSILSFNTTLALVAFYQFNKYPAKIFMGDTGSLALGSIICTVALFTRQPLLLIIICPVFIWTTLSVILQVGIFKIKKKRVFCMAPYHHHLEKKGILEKNITRLYIIITILFCIIGLISLFVKTNIFL